MAGYIVGFCLLSCGFLWIGCKEIATETNNPFTNSTAGNQRIAEAQLSPIHEKKFSGQVSFYPEEKAVKVVGRVDELPPGNYGLFLHKLGNCQNDGQSTGPLLGFNTLNKVAETPPGNLGILKVDEDGSANLSSIKHSLTLSGEKSILGRSVVLRKVLSEKENLAKANKAPIVGCGIIGLTADAPNSGESS